MAVAEEYAERYRLLSDIEKKKNSLVQVWLPSASLTLLADCGQEIIDTNKSLEQQLKHYVDDLDREKLTARHYQAETKKADDLAKKQEKKLVSYSITYLEDST